MGCCMHNLFINIFSPYTFSQKNEGEKILQLICDTCPDLAPEYYGSWEPLNNKFNCNDIKSSLWTWDYNFFSWKKHRKKVEGEIGIRFGKLQCHGEISISTSINIVDIKKVYDFVNNATSLFEADFSYIHLLTDKDIEKYKLNRTVFPSNLKNHSDYNLIITTKTLLKFLPDLYWYTIFGPAYTKHFGISKLLSISEANINQLGESSVTVKLSDNISDMQEKYEKIDKIRENIKLFLNNDSFFDPKKGLEYCYNVPEFIFKEL